MRPDKYTYLKFQRQNKGMTQQKLEEETGIKRWRIQLAENGHLLLGDDELKTLAGYLKCKESVLLDPAENHIKFR